MLDIEMWLYKLCEELCKYFTIVVFGSVTIKWERWRDTWNQWNSSWNMLVLYSH